MELERVLLISASSSRWSREIFRKQSSSPPIGLLSIASVLAMHGYKVKVIDLLVEDYSESEFQQFLQSFDPHVIGIGTYTECHQDGLRVARLIKKTLGDMPIIFGGPHVTFTPQESLKPAEMDYIVMGEGEFAVLELLEHLKNPDLFPISRLRGIAYKMGANIITNERRPVVEKLDALPLPAYHLVERKLYKTYSTVVSSRGCPAQCIFCASRAMSGQRYRYRSAESLYSELFYLSQIWNERYFTVFDDCFTAIRKRVERFCQYLKDSALDLQWRCDSRADLLSYELIDTLASSGCIAIHVGIESGDQGVLNSIGKRIDLKSAENMIEYASKTGITPMCSFIIGHPTDTEDTVEKTVRLGCKLQRDYGALVAFSLCVPFPGTPLREKSAQWKVTIHTDEWSEYILENALISVEHIPMDKLRNLFFEAKQRLRAANAGPIEMVKKATPSSRLSRL